MTITYDTFLVQQRPGVLAFGGARMALLDIEAGFWGLRRQMEALVGRRLTDTVLQQAGANGGASFARAFTGETAAEDSIQALRDCVAAYQAAGFGRFEIVETEWPLGRVLIRADDAFEAWTEHQRGILVETPVCAYTAGVLVGFVNVLTGRQDIVCIERACHAQGADSCLFELLPAQDAGDALVVAFAPDPALGRQLNLLDLLFDRMPMGIAVLDRDYRIRRYNPTWDDYTVRYAPPSGTPLTPGTLYFDHLPGTEPTVLPLFEAVLTGETLRMEAVRLESEGIVSYWDVVLAPITEGKEITGILNVTIDATSRMQTQEELEGALEALREREERLTLVMEGINDGVWDWYIETGKTHFSPRWKSMLGYADAEIPNVIESWQELIHPKDRPAAQEALQEHLDGHTPLYRLEHRLRHKDGGYRWILARGKALRRNDGTPYRLVGSHTDVTERRLAEEALHYRATFENIVSTISTDFIDMPLDEIDVGIQRALQTIGQFTGVDRSYLFRFSEDRTRMDCSHEWSAPGIEPQIARMKDVPVDEFAWSNHRLLHGESLYVPCLDDLPPEAETERQEFRQQGIQSLVAVPMAYRGSTIGFLGFDSVREEKTWSEDSIQLLRLVAAVFANALEHRRAQAIQEGQRHLLELLATGGEFSETLHALVRIIEEQWPGMLGLVLLLDQDGRHLHIGASVSLPEAYVTSIEGLENGPRVGSCGTASYLGERVIVEDIATDERWEGLRDLALTHGLRACWSEPVFSPAGDVVATFAMYYRHRRSPTQAELRAIETAAYLVGVAVETRRIREALREAYDTLEQHVEERTHELATLLQVSHDVNSALEVERLLDLILDQLKTVVDYSGASILILEDKALAVRAYRGPIPEADARQLRFPLDEALVNRQVTQSREPIVIPDVLDDTPLARLFRQTARRGAESTFDYVRAWLGVPLMVKGNVLGMLTLDHHQPGQLTARHAELALAFANQVAVAIENARLYAQAAESAVAAERNRLARDLHDAVTQTLFSASLIAEVLPRIWERHPDEGQRRLAELRELTRGALAEMRTLLLELRPAALEETHLTDLLSQLAESVTGRARVPVAFETEGECNLPVEVKVALYRIAQEALNNVAKHAGASEAAVRLRCAVGRAELCVRDDGLGFEQENVPLHSLGLGIMRERAETIGAALSVQSAPGAGTRITVVWQSDDR